MCSTGAQWNGLEVLHLEKGSCGTAIDSNLRNLPTALLIRIPRQTVLPRHSLKIWRLSILLNLGRQITSLSTSTPHRDQHRYLRLPALVRLRDPIPTHFRDLQMTLLHMERPPLEHRGYD